MLIRRFIYDQIFPDNVFSTLEVPLTACPFFSGKVHVFNSAVATFHAPSDPSGAGGMRQEHIRAVASWRKGLPQYDCAFLSTNPDIPGMLRMSVVRIWVFLSFTFEGKSYPCTLVHWYKRFQELPDNDTGLWVLQPELDDAGNPEISIIHSAEHG
jgi:hypothetical protein